MDERRRKQIFPISQPPYYGNEEEKYEFCKFCLHGWMKRTPKTPTQCPHCGEPYFGN
jgi:rubrerythrin